MPAGFSDGYGLLTLADGYRYLDKTGKIHPDLSKPPLKEANSFSEGLAFVKLADGRSGYVNKEFRLVIECNMGGEFKDGVAPVESDEIGSATIFIDKTGKKVF